MKRNVARLALTSGVAVLLSGAAGSAQSSLGTAQSFVVLAGSAVTNTGASLLTGDLGVSPGTAISGFPPGILIGATHTDGVSLQAQNDVITQYNALVAAACTSNLTGQDLGGMTLTPGVYCFDSSAQLTGALTLNAQNNPAATFIFKTVSTLTTANGSSVGFINGGNPCGVAWQIGSSATLGTTTTFIGNLIALTSITLNTGATISGRALARNGAVTLDSNTISFAACGVSPPAVPALSTWAVIALMGLLAMAGFVAVRQRRARPVRR
jgi:hypothetical protein